MLSHFKNYAPQIAIAQLRAKLQQSPLAHRLAKGAAWSLVGAVSSRLLVLASTAVIVRILGKEQFGEYGMVQSTLLLLGTFAGMGLGITATKHTAELRVTDPRRAGGLLGLVIAAAAVGGLVMSVFGWMSSEWLASPRARPGVARTVSPHHGDFGSRSAHSMECLPRRLLDSRRSNKLHASILSSRCSVRSSRCR